MKSQYQDGGLSRLFCSTPIQHWRQFIWTVITSMIMCWLPLQTLWCTILCWKNCDRIITVTGWDAFSNALCNKTSIDATLNSNHTLQRFFHQERHEAQLPTYLILLLRLNRELTKVEAARWKILQVHFSGAFNMQPFIDMDLKALPHAIAWMAKDNHGSSLTYKFVRNTTFFFNVGSGGMEAANEPEPKRQKT